MEVTTGELEDIYNGIVLEVKQNKDKFIKKKNI